MNVLDAVLAEVRTGARPGLVAARLGIDPGLAEAALDHWVRLGVVTPTADLGLGCAGCGTDPQAGPVPAGCRGCPIAGAAPSRAPARPAHR